MATHDLSMPLGRQDGVYKLGSRAPHECKDNWVIIEHSRIIRFTESHLEYYFLASVFRVKLPTCTQELLARLLL